MNKTASLKENIKSGCIKCSGKSGSILNEIEIINHFQPIISNINHTIAGFESLTRGLCKHCNRIIPPLELFKMLRNEKELLRVDIEARKNAVKVFSDVPVNNNEILLLLNFDANLIEKKIENPERLVNLCKNTNVKPNNIVIEITESKPCNIDVLLDFIEHCRKHGFLIALDDVGSGYSNFDRIAVIKPDILKLDRSIINNLDKDYHKKVIFRSMSRLASKIGMLLLAEGVETKDEILYSLELGADLLQGFYFAVPGIISPDMILSVEKKISYTEAIFKNYKIERIRHLKRNYQAYDEVIDVISDCLAEANQEEFNSLLENYDGKYDFIESMFVLDNNGIQITDSHLNCNVCNIKPKIFKLLKKGDTHFYKEYFYLLQGNLFKKHTTDTYLSNTTGYLCRTIAKKFCTFDQKSYILCINIKE